MTAGEPAVRLSRGRFVPFLFGFVMGLQVVQISLSGDVRVKSIALDSLPITIGRGSQASCKIPGGFLPQEFWGLLSRIHATIYRSGDVIYLSDGHGDRPSGHGCYVNGRRIYDDQRIYEGVEIDLLLQSNACRLYVTWTARRPENISNLPTLEIQRDTALMESAELEVKIVDLSDKLAEMEKTVCELDSQLKDVHLVNRQQDRRLRHLRWIGFLLIALGSVVIWLFLGQDMSGLRESLDLAVGIAGILAGVYMSVGASARTNKGESP